MILLQQNVVFFFLSLFVPGNSCEKNGAYTTERNCHSKGGAHSIFVGPMCKCHVSSQGSDSVPSQGSQGSDRIPAVLKKNPLLPSSKAAEPHIEDIRKFHTPHLLFSLSFVLSQFPFGLKSCINRTYSIFI
jgi:hypothetical protein